MSYYRLYPTKNNTIFRYKEASSYASQDINCGANTIMELMDGKGESRLMFGFEVPTWLLNKLNAYSYTANFQLFDAGTLYEPAIKLKNIKLESFVESFVEGDGYSFLQPENYVGVSNWLKRDSVNNWAFGGFAPVLSYHLNSINEDLNFDITNSVADFLSQNYTLNYSLTIDNRDTDTTSIYRKFIYSRHTRTVFRPYIEFFINDTIEDKTYNFYALDTNKIYLINQRAGDFSGTVTADITVDGVTSTVTATKVRDGVYSVSITANNFSITGKTIAQVLWKINSNSVQKLNIDVKNPNELIERYNFDDLFFYPVTPSTHNICRQGDVLPFSVVSEIRGKGTIVLENYEYRITSMDGFEMVPWTKCSVYRDKIYFNIFTDYFFPENQYEVFVRYKTDDIALTSTLTHKFKVAMSDKSHLRELSASPYYSREQFISK
jgi:hypothetical protein